MLGELYSATKDLTQIGKTRVKKQPENKIAFQVYNYLKNIFFHNN